MYTKNLFLEAYMYSHWENINFMNVEESREIGSRTGEDMED